MRAWLCVLCVLCATPVAAQDDPHTTLFRSSMVAAVAAHGADLSTTEYCLGAGRCREMNPFLARFNQPAVFGAAKMTIAALQLWLVAQLHEHFPKAAIAVNVATTIGFSFIAAHNARAGR